VHKYFFKVTVTGSGRFPIDQLRRYEMFPINVETVTEIEASFEDPHYLSKTYTLGMYANTLGADGPCRARFESFGFSMVTDEIWKDNELFELNGEVVARFTNHTCEGMTA
jgi:hypothetical protein